MWALRRAAIPARSFTCRILAADNCLIKPEPLGNFLGKSLSDVSWSVPWCQRFSSGSGGKFNEHESELEKGFSDLEVHPEAELYAGTQGLSDTEIDLDDEKGSGKKQSVASIKDVDGRASLDAEAGLGEKNGKMRLGSPLLKVIWESRNESVMSALDKWVEKGNPIGRDEASVAILYLRRGRQYGKALQLVEWLDKKSLLEFVERDYASHLDLVAKVHGVQNAERYIQYIPQSFRGEMVYRTLLANCVISTNAKKAEEVFKKMRDLGFPLTTFACNQLLLLYKRVDRKKIADVLILMEKENVKPDLFTYKLLIDSKGSSKDFLGMEQVLESMKADGVEPDLDIQAAVAKHYIIGGENMKAEAALKEMEGDNIQENRSAWEHLLRLYADLGKADDVARIWKLCESSPPRLAYYLAAIEAFGKQGHVEGAEEVFENMTKKWDKLSGKYYNALLKVYANHKLLSKGKELEKRMSDNGCWVGPQTWDILVRLHVMAGEVEKADSILYKAVQLKQGKPLYSSFMTILGEYANRGDVHNAEKIFLQMKQCGYSGKFLQYERLLQAYVHAKVPAFGFRERMKADNMFANRTMGRQLDALDPFKTTQLSKLLD